MRALSTFVQCQNYDLWLSVRLVDICHLHGMDCMDRIRKKESTIDRRFFLYVRTTVHKFVCLFNIRRCWRYIWLFYFTSCPECTVVGPKTSNPSGGSGEERYWKKEANWLSIWRKSQSTSCYYSPNLSLSKKEIKVLASSYSLPLSFLFWETEVGWIIQ